MSVLVCMVLHSTRRIRWCIWCIGNRYENRSSFSLRTKLHLERRRKVTAAAVNRRSSSSTIRCRFISSRCTVIGPSARRRCRREIHHVLRRRDSQQYSTAGDTPADRRLWLRTVLLCKTISLVLFIWLLPIILWVLTLLAARRAGCWFSRRGVDSMRNLHLWEAGVFTHGYHGGVDFHALG